jgi:hypothetical protein
MLGGAFGSDKFDNFDGLARRREPAVRTVIGCDLYSTAMSVRLQ